MLEKDFNGNPISTIPPSYAFQMIFTALTPRLIESKSCNVHNKNGALKHLCVAHGLQSEKKWPICARLWLIQYLIKIYFAHIYNKLLLVVYIVSWPIKIPVYVFLIGKDEPAMINSHIYIKVGYKFRGSIFKSEEKITLAVFFLVKRK